MQVPGELAYCAFEDLAGEAITITQSPLTFRLDPHLFAKGVTSIIEKDFGAYEAAEPMPYINEAATFVINDVMVDPKQVV